MRGGKPVDAEQAYRFSVLTVLLIAGGCALVALAALSVVMGIEGARGPTPRLGRLAYVWEIIFVLATPVLLVGMLWVPAALHSVASWTLAILAAVALVAAAIVAVARWTGAMEVLFPLANWVPGTVLIAFWGWAAGRRAVRSGRLPSAMSAAAATVAALQVGVLVVAGAVFGVAGGRDVALNIAAGLIVPAIMAMMGAWWICLGVWLRTPQHR